MKRFLIALAYGLGGLLVALVLSLGAFALAGREISQPATPVEPAFSLSASPKPAGSPTDDPPETPPSKPSQAPTAASSPSLDGPSPSSGSGSSGEDHPGSGHHGGEDD